MTLRDLACDGLTPNFWVQFWVPWVCWLLLLCFRAACNLDYCPYDLAWPCMWCANSTSGSSSEFVGCVVYFSCVVGQLATLTVAPMTLHDLACDALTYSVWAQFWVAGVHPLLLGQLATFHTYDLAWPCLWFANWKHLGPVLCHLGVSYTSGFAGNCDHWPDDLAWSFMWYVRWHAFLCYVFRWVVEGRRRSYLLACKASLLLLGKKTLQFLVRMMCRCCFVGWILKCCSVYQLARLL